RTLVSLRKGPQNLLCFVGCSYRYERFGCSMGKRYRGQSGPALQEMPSNFESDSGVVRYRALGKELRHSIVKVKSRGTCNCVISLGTNQFVPKLQVTANLA